MPSKFPSTSEETVLPITTWRRVAEPKENKLESALFYVCLVTLLFLFGSIYYRDAIPKSSPFAYLVCLLDAGMLSSLWASLPAPVVLFAFAPYFAEPSKVPTVRYSIYLLYILGVVMGALVFGHETMAMQCAMDVEIGGPGCLSG